MALVVLNDADDHCCGVAVDHCLAPALGVQDLLWGAGWGVGGMEGNGMYGARARS